MQLNAHVVADVRKQFGSETAADLKPNGVTKLGQTLENLLGKDSEWELFQNHVGILDSEGIAVRASLSLAQMPLTCIEDVITELDKRETDEESAVALEEAIMRARVFHEFMTDPGEHDVEQKRIPIDNHLWVELLSMTCKDLAGATNGGCCVARCPATKMRSTFAWRSARALQRSR